LSELQIVGQYPEIDAKIGTDSFRRGRRPLAIQIQEEDLRGVVGFPEIHV
jgi:hypothetical protein